jgi:formate hydrogenlyase subunit 3/multisubunit Na+/H+ antiporter MnhD subunit
MNAAIPWIILFAPLVSAALILFFGKYSRKLSAGLAIFAALLSSALSWWLFFQPGEVHPIEVLWINIPDILTIPLATIDPLSRTCSWWFPIAARLHHSTAGSETWACRAGPSSFHARPRITL